MAALERRAPNEPPRTGAAWDKCKRCDHATNFTTSDQKKNKRTGAPIWFENWSCPEGCGHWWKIKGSDFKPEWRDA